jgi:serine/threonine protein kinase
MLTMHTVKAPNTEPLPGYRLIEPLGKGGFGEVWKCEVPGGLLKAIKFVSESNHIADAGGAGAEQELRALQHVKTIRHPFLLSIERVEILDGELMIVTELADRSLHDLLVQYQSAGQTGIPRAELLNYMREAAEAIDLLNHEHGLQHLDIKPRNLFLIGRHIKVADFGLVASLNDLNGPTTPARGFEAVTPLYASPETFLGRFTLYSDQYSLAISYHELRTGGFPFAGSNFRQLAMCHVRDEPDLQRLPEEERPLLARALAKEPTARYPSCCAFIEALAELRDAPVAQIPPSRRTPIDIRLGDLTVTPGTKEARTRSAPAATPAPASPGAIVSNPAAFLAEYQLLECINRQTIAEVWRAQKSDGQKRLIRLVNSFDAARQHSGGDPLVRLRELRHASLLPLEVQLGPGGRLALLSEAPDSTLLDRLRECQQAGQRGIPRRELLDNLGQIAEALDALTRRHGLQHLGLTPRQLVRKGGRLFLLDFGLIELLWLPAGHDAAALNTRYAAPELFEGQVSRQCDQYSLALIYQELLTGIHPFRNLNQRQMALARLRGRPDLGMLPALDRAVVERALHTDPDKRFPTCSDFVGALEDVSTERGQGSGLHGTGVQGSTIVVPAQPDGGGTEPAACTKLAEVQWGRPLEELKQMIAEQVAAAANGWEVCTHQSLRYRLRRLPPRRRGETASPALEHFGFGRIVPGTVPLRLTGFEDEWRARRIEPAEGAAKLGLAAPVPPGESLLYQLRFADNLWQRCMGRYPGLFVQIDLRPPQTMSESLTDVTVRLYPVDCSSKKGIELVEKIAPQLLQSLRDYLQLAPDRRGEERIACADNVQVYPVFSEQEIGEGFAAQIKDISAGGLGIYLPCQPPCEFLLVQMGPAPGTALIIPVQALHAHPCGDGRHVIGARFAWEIVERYGR